MINRQVLERLATMVCDRQGDVVEIGVHRGASAAVIGSLLPNDRMLLFDTFCGMPNIVEPIDGHRAGEFSNTSVDIVRKTMGERSVEIYEGVFPASAEAVDCRAIKFAHIDVDLYRSTRDALNWVWDRLVPGGVIVDDDYAASLCRGAKKAVDEFSAAHALNVEQVGHSCFIVRKCCESGGTQ